MVNLKVLNAIVNAKQAAITENVETKMNLHKEFILVILQVFRV